MLRMVLYSMPSLALLLLIYANYKIARSPVLVEPISRNSGKITPQTQPKDTSKLASNDATLGTPYAHTLERPLFEETRRVFKPAPKLPPVRKPKPVKVAKPIVLPATPKTPPKPIVIPKPPSLRLIGTNITPTRQSALVQIEGSETKWVQTSELINGWQVAKIASDSILLKNLDQSTRVTLYPETDEKK